MIPAPTPEQVRQHERGTELQRTVDKKPLSGELLLPHGRGEPRSMLDAAKALQRKGLTFTEIADLMRVSRESIVNALFWERVW